MHLLESHELLLLLLHEVEDEKGVHIALDLTPVDLVVAGNVLLRRNTALIFRHFFVVKRRTERTTVSLLLPLLLLNRFVLFRFCVFL